MSIKLEVLNDLKLEYITKGYTLLQLSRVYKVSSATLGTHARKEGWKEQRLKYLSDTELETRKALVVKQAEMDAYDRHERAKEFKRIVKQNVEKLLDDKLKSKSHETLLSSTVNASQHIELLEGNATNRADINLTDERRKEIDLLVNRYSHKESIAGRAGEADREI